MRPQAFPSALQISDGPPTTPRHAPCTHPTPRSRPSFPSFPQSRNPCDLKLHVSAPDQHGTRPSFPTAPPFRHSCAGRNPCDLKLPVSAPDQRRPPNHSAPRSLHPPHPSVLPLLFRHSPVQARGRLAGRNPCDLKPSRQRSSQPTARRHSRHAPCTHATPGLAPHFRHSCAGRNPCDLKLPVSAPEQRRPPTTHATLPAPTPPAPYAPPRGEGSPLLSLRDISPRRAGGEGIRTQSPHLPSGGRTVQSLPNPSPTP